MESKKRLKPFVLNGFVNIHVFGVDHYPMVSGDYNKSLGDLAIFYINNLMSNHQWDLDRLQRVSLMGWSMGGHIALEMAAQLESLGVKEIDVGLKKILLSRQMAMIRVVRLAPVGGT